MVHVKRNEISIKRKYIPPENKPYYYIVYKENGVWHEGYGSYNYYNVKMWIDQFFIVED